MTDTTQPQARADRNILGLDGLEFVEYSTSNPEAFGAMLQHLGFVKVAHHRSRRVFLYRQGTMNVIVDADPDMVVATTSGKDEVVLSALAFRVADAGAAYQRLIGLGAWPIPTRAGAMELNIPGVHGVGDSIIYLVDRYQDFSIYDVDFEYESGVDRQPPALAGLHLFGAVQVVDAWRIDEWFDFYAQLFGFTLDVAAGSELSEGVLLRSPCGRFRLQLVELPQDLSRDEHWDEGYDCLLLGAPDVGAAEQLLRARGVAFAPARADAGPRTRAELGEAQFELVPDPEPLPT